MIPLGQNYRSTANILNAAKGLIESNGQRLDHELFTENARRDSQCYVDEAYDEDEEAGKVIGEIKRLTREEGLQAGRLRGNVQGERPVSRSWRKPACNRELSTGWWEARASTSARKSETSTAYLRLIHSTSRTM